jgi:hypothetical protein
VLTLSDKQNYYAPQIFQGLGMSGTSVQLFATGVYGIVKVVGCFLFLVFVADSLGRRRSLLWTSAAQAISMYIVGAYGKTEPPQAGKPVSSYILTFLRMVVFSCRGVAAGEGMAGFRFRGH